MSVLCNWESLCTKILVANLQSSGLRLTHGNIAPIKIIHAAKILWIVLSWICNMNMPWHHFGKNYYTYPWLTKVHVFYQLPESHYSYLLGSKHLNNISNFSTGKPYSIEILMAFNSGIFRRKHLIEQLFSFKLFILVC